MWGVLRPIYMYQPLRLSTPKLPYEEPLVWEILRVVNWYFNSPCHAIIGQLRRAFPAIFVLVSGSRKKMRWVASSSIDATTRIVACAFPNDATFKAVIYVRLLCKAGPASDSFRDHQRPGCPVPSSSLPCFGKKHLHDGALVDLLYLLVNPVSFLSVMCTRPCSCPLPITVQLLYVILPCYWSCASSLATGAEAVLRIQVAVFYDRASCMHVLQGFTYRSFSLSLSVYSLITPSSMLLSHKSLQPCPPGRLIIRLWI